MISGESIRTSTHAVRPALGRAAIPAALGMLIALLPVPAGLDQHAWYYFAIFASVIAALITEPLPNPAVGLVAVTFVAIMSRWVLFSPAQLADPRFEIADASIDWAIAGFSNATVWLVFGAFMFALGYEKTGLGKRIALLLVRSMGRRTLTLGYATTLADTLLAPFTPSNTARSGGTIFPVVSNLPPLYDSHPNDPSARRIGSYIMWTTFAASCVTSSLFMTACAPNLLAREFIREITGVDLTWQGWLMHAAVFAVPLLLALPVIAYWIYPPQIKSGNKIADWAGSELARMGLLSRREIILTALVSLAVVLWVIGGSFIDTAMVTLVVISLMLVTGIVTWSDMLGNRVAWTTLILLSTLVTLANGLSATGFVDWFAHAVGTHLDGLSPGIAIGVLVVIYFFSHYMFASLTAHTTALMPVMLAMGMSIPGMPVDKLAMALAMTTGIMGVITPYATGAGLPYYESGYLSPRDFWRLGAIFGAIFLAALVCIGVPFLLY